MQFIDYYKILGVTKDATEKEIKAAYRKLARKYHPDVNPNNASAEQNFKEINEANEVLGDPVKRKKYDRYGKDWQHAEEFEKAQKTGAANKNAQRENTGGFQGQAFGGNDFSDFFEAMFGSSENSTSGFGGAGRQVKFRGQDINAELQMSLQDAYTTQKQTLGINGGTIRITIPAGIENGQTIKIAGRGGPGRNGGPNGDLYLTFRIENHTDFKRDGANLYKAVELDLYTAVLGGEVTVATFDGKAKLTIKPETQSGTTVKLKGKGFPVYKREALYGDLFITFNVKVPSGLTYQEKELFKQLASIKKQ